MKPHFNYFTSGIVPKVIDSKIHILVTDYFDSSDHKQKMEIRIPGGTVQIVDILKGFQKVSPKLKLSNDKKIWIEQQIKDISSSYVYTVKYMPANTNREKKEIRDIFEKALEEIADSVDSLCLSDQEIRMIERSCKRATLERELLEECATAEFSEEFECDCIVRNEKHFQYPYLILKSDTPDEYTGSSDPDVKKSYFMDLEKLCNELYLPHRPFLRNAINKWSFVLEHEEGNQKLIDQINRCLQPN